MTILKFRVCEAFCLGFTPDRYPESVAPRKSVHICSDVANLGTSRVSREDCRLARTMIALKMCRALRR